MRNGALPSFLDPLNVQCEGCCKQVLIGKHCFPELQKNWMNSKITLERKLKVYEAQVLSITMYNSSCWAAPAAVLEKLDICHRKHLRTIKNIWWPCSMISNDTLYKRCNTTPISEREQLSHVGRCWDMFWGVLRTDRLKVRYVLPLMQ
jgi:hypothetical protein